MTTISRRVEVDVDVDVDLSDFDDEDIIEYMRGRGLTSGLPDDLNEQRQAMLKSLWSGDAEKTIGLLKTYLCDCLGRAVI